MSEYARMNVLVIYYDGNTFHTEQCEIDDDGQSYLSMDPAVFGLTVTVDISAVIITPDIDKTVVAIDGEVSYGEIG